MLPLACPGFLFAGSPDRPFFVGRIPNSCLCVYLRGESGICYLTCLHRPSLYASIRRLLSARAGLQTAHGSLLFVTACPIDIHRGLQSTSHQSVARASPLIPSADRLLKPPFFIHFLTKTHQTRHFFEILIQKLLKLLIKSSTI